MIRWTIIARSNSALIPVQDVCYKTQFAERNFMLFGYKNSLRNFTLRVSIAYFEYSNTMAKHLRLMLANDGFDYS